MLNKKILIIFIHNQKSGLGHSKRMNSLYISFKKKKINCTIKKIKKKMDIKKIKFNPYSTIIFDLNFRIKDKIKDLKKQNKTVITFDYFNYDNQDANFSVFEQRKNIKGKRFAGFKYSLISEEIKNIIPNKKGDKDSIAIFGGQKFKIKNKVIKELISKTDFKLNFFNNEKKKSNLRINYFKRDCMKHHINKFKFCITNCGISLLEAIYLKKIVFVLPQTKNEKNFANFLISNKIALDCVKNNKFSLTSIKLKSMSDRVSNLIDGKADQRIIKTIKNL